MKQSKVSVGIRIEVLNRNKFLRWTKWTKPALCFSVFLDVLFLIISWATSVLKSCVFSALYLSILFFSPQKPKISLLDLFQLHSKYQAPCSKELLQGDHLINQGLAQSCTHPFCSPSLLCWFLSSSQKLSQKFHINRRELSKISHIFSLFILILLFFFSQFAVFVRYTPDIYSMLSENFFEM